jgi:hypothetical protein
MLMLAFGAWAAAVGVNLPDQHHGHGRRRSAKGQRGKLMGLRLLIEPLSPRS